MDAKVARERSSASSTNPTKIKTAEDELKHIFQKIGQAADNGAFQVYYEPHWHENRDKLKTLGYRLEIGWPTLVTYISWYQAGD